MILKQMVYQHERKIELLYQGEIDGYRYYVMSLGTHPTAYVELPKTSKYFGKNYNDIDEEIQDCVNGGLTYSDSSLTISETERLENSWFIGWDYAHWGDYYCYEHLDFLDLRGGLNNGKKWTTEEIIEECKKIIGSLKFSDELAKLYTEYKENS